MSVDLANVISVPIWGLFNLTVMAGIFIIILGLGNFRPHLGII